MFSSSQFAAKIRLAYSTSTGPKDFVFHIGYQGIELPKWLRCLVAKSEYHRAWFSGYYGGGILGVLERVKAD